MSVDINMFTQNTVSNVFIPEAAPVPTAPILPTLVPNSAQAIGDLPPPPPYTPPTSSQQAPAPTSTNVNSEPITDAPVLEDAPKNSWLNKVLDFVKAEYNEVVVAYTHESTRTALLLTLGKLLTATAVAGIVLFPIGGAILGSSTMCTLLATNELLVQGIGVTLGAIVGLLTNIAIAYGAKAAIKSTDLHQYTSQTSKELWAESVIWLTWCVAFPVMKVGEIMVEIGKWKILIDLIQGKNPRNKNSTTTQ